MVDDPLSCCVCNQCCITLERIHSILSEKPICTHLHERQTSSSSRSSSHRTILLLPRTPHPQPPNAYPTLNHQTPSQPPHRGNFSRALFPNALHLLTTTTIHYHASTPLLLHRSPQKLGTTSATHVTHAHLPIHMPNMPTEIFHVAVAPLVGAGGEETYGERTMYVYI
jgi:hypothetical protein